MATFGLSGLRLGPDQRTGITPSRFQVTTFSRSPVMAMMVAVCRLTPFAKLADPGGQFGAVLADGAAQLDVAVLDSGRQLPDEPVVPALLALLDHHLETESFTGVEQTQVVAVDADGKADADRRVVAWGWLVRISHQSSLLLVHGPATAPPAAAR